MELPEKLMRMATQKRAHKEFGYVTYQVILFFDNGERLGGGEHHNGAQTIHAKRIGT